MKKETYNILKSGKRNGAEILYKRYAAKLFSYAVKNQNIDEDIAWDLIYKTFESIEANIGKYNFESEKKFASFLLVSFLNRYKNHLRDKKNKVETVAYEHIENIPTEADVIEQKDSDKMKALKNELDKLQDWERMLLLLRAQQMPYSEIAKYVKKPEKQLKVYYARLKKKISDKLIMNDE